MAKKIILLALLSALLLLTACGGSTKNDDPRPPMNGEEIFSSRDNDPSFDPAASAVITLSGATASTTSDAVRIGEGAVTVTDEGTYILRGSFTGTVTVDADKDDKIQLVLDGVSIHSESSAALYLKTADKVFLTLNAETENALSSGEAFVSIDENNIDAALFSKTDLTLNGAGSLTITSPAGHGIVSKDDLKITGGSICVTASGHALDGKDRVCISGGTLLLAAGKDGIHAENGEDVSLGYAFLSGGDYDITAEGDGISASGRMQIDGGSYTLLTGGGSENGESHTSDGWGGFPGGGMMRPGGRSTAVTSTEDSTSIKGIKSGGDLLITGGSFVIDAADDAVHSNASITVTGGDFSIETGDDGFHADATLTVSGGKIDVTESYEGLEGLHIKLSGSDVSLVADDDGINAAGGTDGSGTGGRDQMGGPPPGMGGGSSSKGSIVISGGTLYIEASGDGIDANGSILIEGGYTTVCGPTSGDTATLDYDTTANITGGTFIGTGAAGMAQTFSESTQGVIALQFGTQAAETAFCVSDADGKVILEYAPKLSSAVFIFSAPELETGKSYTVTVGSYTGTFEAS